MSPPPPPGGLKLLYNQETVRPMYMVRLLLHTTGHIS